MLFSTDTQYTHPISYTISSIITLSGIVHWLVLYHKYTFPLHRAPIFVSLLPLRQGPVRCVYKIRQLYVTRLTADMNPGLVLVFAYLPVSGVCNMTHSLLVGAQSVGNTRQSRLCWFNSKPKYRNRMWARRCGCGGGGGVVLIFTHAHREE